MVNRYFIRISFVAFALVGLFLAGCKTTADVGAPVLTGKIRIANFQANNDPAKSGFASSFDVYLYPADGPADLIPKAFALGYGIVTPYITNLETGGPAGKAYTLIIRKASDKDSEVVKTTVTIKPEDKLTFVLFNYDTTGKKLDYALISDAPPSGANANLAYFRFINTVQEDIVVRVGDPVTGDGRLNSKGGNPVPAIPYKVDGDYIGFTTALDTTLTFYIIRKSDNSILGRLSGVSLVGGSYHTITWGGADVRRKAASGTLPDDSARVRILDDDQLGNDASFPIQQNLRFIFVNALIPASFANPITPTIPDYTQLGIIINNDAHYNFRRLTPCSFAPRPVFEQGGAQWVIPVTLPLTEAINVKAFVYDNADTEKRGTLLADYRVGKRSDIQSDKLVAIVLGDSTFKSVPLDSNHIQVAVPIPDDPVTGGMARIIVVNAMAKPPKPALASTANIKFFINDVAKYTVGTWTPTTFHPKSSEPELLVNAGEVSLKADLVVTPTETIPEFKFTADDGGIYLVVICGERLHKKDEYHPHFTVAKVNPQWPKK